MKQIGMGLALLLGLGCPAVAADNGQEDQIIMIDSQDAEMNAAKARAIASLPDFYRRFARPGADESDFMVKFDIDPSDQAEFVWASQLDRSRTPMTGILINQPAYTDDRLGDRVAIPEESIIDWGYWRAGVMQGSFTTRVLIAHMPPDQAREYRAALGW